MRQVKLTLTLPFSAVHLAKQCSWQQGGDMCIVQDESLIALERREKAAHAELAGRNMHGAAGRWHRSNVCFS